MEQVEARAIEHPKLFPFEVAEIRRSAGMARRVELRIFKSDDWLWRAPSWPEEEVELSICIATPRFPAVHPSSRVLVGHRALASSRRQRLHPDRSWELTKIHAGAT